MNRPTAWIGAGVCALALSACASNGDLGALGAKGTLQHDVQALSYAAATGNKAATSQAMATLKTHLAAARAAGYVDNARYASIVAAIAAISTDLAPPTPTPTPTPVVIVSGEDGQQSTVSGHAKGHKKD